MNEVEYEEMLEECYSVPILELGMLVVPGYEIYRGKPTGQCCKHIDNKKGNFSFKTDGNYARCFTCQETFTTINLVKEFKGLAFKDAVMFLYQNFPTYFSKEPFSGEYVYVKDNWDGLTNQEYMYLKMPTRLLLNGEKVQMREFAKLHPIEHDLLLVNTIISCKQLIENIYNSFLTNNYDNRINISKVKRDRKDMYYKLLNLLSKGIRNKDLLKKFNGKLDLDVLIVELNNKQKKLKVVS